MAGIRKDKKAEEMYKLYRDGFSLAQVGRAFGVSRQSVYGIFETREWVCRNRPKPLPFIIFNNSRYTLRNNGYYGKTKGGRTLLHRDVWEFTNGQIPPHYDIHHIDENPSNNSCENLELIKKSRHGEIHSTGINQNTNATHCKRGHVFDEKNTRIWNGHRICRECTNMRAREKYSKR